MTAVRNPQLVHILDKMNYIENYRTGIDRMLKAYQGTGPHPEFKVTAHMFKVTFPNLNYQSKEKGAISKPEIQEALNLSDYSSRKLVLNLRKEIKLKN